MSAVDREVLVWVRGRRDVGRGFDQDRTTVESRKSDQRKGAMDLASPFKGRRLLAYGEVEEGVVESPDEKVSSCDTRSNPFLRWNRPAAEVEDDLKKK